MREDSSKDAEHDVFSYTRLWEMAVTAVLAGVALQQGPNLSLILARTDTSQPLASSGTRRRCTLNFKKSGEQIKKAKASISQGMYELS